MKAKLNGADTKSQHATSVAREDSESIENLRVELKRLAVEVSELRDTSDSLRRDRDNLRDMLNEQSSEITLLRAQRSGWASEKGLLVHELAAAHRKSFEETEALVDSKLSAAAAHDAPRSTKDLLATVVAERSRLVASFDTILGLIGGNPQKPLHSERGTRATGATGRLSPLDAVDARRALISPATPTTTSSILKSSRGTPTPISGRTPSAGRVNRTPDPKRPSPTVTPARKTPVGTPSGGTAQRPASARGSGGGTLFATSPAVAPAAPAGDRVFVHTSTGDALSCTTPGKDQTTPIGARKSSEVRPSSAPASDKVPGRSIPRSPAVAANPAGAATPGGVSDRAATPGRSLDAAAGRTTPTGRKTPEVNALARREAERIDKLYAEDKKRRLEKAATEAQKAWDPNSSVKKPTVNSAAYSDAKRKERLAEHKKKMLAEKPAAAQARKQVDKSGAAMSAKKDEPAEDEGGWNLEALNRDGDIGGALLHRKGGDPDAADLFRCRAFGTGVESVVVGYAAEFTVLCLDNNDRWIQGETFDVTVSKDDVALSKGSFKDMGDGSYQMTYSVEEAGEYEIYVSARGVDIAGSPFVVFAADGSSGGPVPAVGAAEAGAADFHPDLVAIQSDVDASLPPRPASPEY